MRHGHGYRKLGRTSSHRVALLKNLAIAIIKSEKIETTLPKAKELRSYIEKLITRARKGDSNAHRAVFASLQDKETTNKLVTEIAPKFSNRNGGYTRIIKTRIRKGDAAEMAFIELVGEWKTFSVYIYFCLIIDATYLIFLNFKFILIRCLFINLLGLVYYFNFMTFLFKIILFYFLRILFKNWYKQNNYQLILKDIKITI